LDHGQLWSGDFFEKTTLAKLGLRYQLGHGGDVCSNPVPGPRDFTVFDVTGVHPVNIDYCGCREGSATLDKTIQLLRSSLFPATLSRPQTVFTFEMLETFHQLTLQAKTTVYDYYNSIVHRSDALELEGVPVSGSKLR
jgi:hypothetical protein